MVLFFTTENNPSIISIHNNCRPITLVCGHEGRNQMSGLVDGGEGEKYNSGTQK